MKAIFHLPFLSKMFYSLIQLLVQLLSKHHLE